LAGDCLIEVVEKNKQLVGILDVAEEQWRNTAWIWNIMLDVEMRRQGLGRQLMQRTIDWAKQRRLRAILLETQSNNTPACHFYARLGFQLIGINELFYTNQDMERQEVALFWGYPLR
jgi:ribosomal protein S18 acetylase RimI-like enzyme